MNPRINLVNKKLSSNPNLSLKIKQFTLHHFTILIIPNRNNKLESKTCQESTFLAQADKQRLVDSHVIRNDAKLANSLHLHNYHSKLY